jgi:beta-N-acetylhexosaminidase
MTTSDRLRTAARCLVVGVSSPEISDDDAAELGRLRPGGLILFRRNLITPDQTRALARRFAELVPDRAIVAIDQEGGRVSRLEGWIGPTLPARRFGEGDPASVRRFGRVTAEALACLGVNLDFAPVADLSAPDADNGIGDRAFGTDPRHVARMTRAFLEGLQGGGVAGCLKHFPGLGDTAVDSHLELPTVHRDAGRLEAEDLLPYRELATLPATVMVGHAHYPAFDGEEPLPATMSHRIVTELLRRRLGYTGLIVGDDMEMGAIADRDEDGRAAVAVLRAGCDLLLYCSDLERAAVATRALAEAARRDTALEGRLNEAAARVDVFARRWPVPPASDDATWRRRVEAFTPFRA